MQFLVVGKDGNDKAALERRMNARPEHLALAMKLKEEGHLLMAAALLSEKQEMCGSIMLMNYDERHELDDYLKLEPYVQKGVWQDIEIKQIAVAAAFLPASRDP